MRESDLTGCARDSEGCLCDEALAQVAQPFGNRVGKWPSANRFGGSVRLFQNFSVRRFGSVRPKIAGSVRVSSQRDKKQKNIGAKMNAFRKVSRCRALRVGKWPSANRFGGSVWFGRFGVSVWFGGSAGSVRLSQNFSVRFGSVRFGRTANPIRKRGDLGADRIGRRGHCPKDPLVG